MSAIGGVPRHASSEDGYEEVAEDFEVFRLGGEDRTNRMERPIGTRAG